MTTSHDTKLQELLEEFDVAMLVTRTMDGHLRARPMALAEVQPDGLLWFLTDRRSGKVEDLQRDAHVAVTMQAKSKFVSLSGTASQVEDRGRVVQLWKLGWQVWFPGGKDDPNLMLLRVVGQAGEYWDTSGTSGIKYFFEAGKALLTGNRPDVDRDPKAHRKVDL
jgi:general stress protein 26